MSNITIEELQNDCNVRNQFIEDNMNLVFWVYNKLPKSRITIRDKDDLISEGILGYIEAIDRYDETKNSKINTYAVFWIQKYMYSYLEKSEMIKIPCKEKKRISQNNDSSLFVSLENENEKELDDLMSNDNVEDNVINNIENEEIKAIIEAKLTIIEQKVINLLFGLNDEDSIPVSNIAKSLNTDVYSIYNIRKRAYKKLCSPMKEVICCS